MPNPLRQDTSERWKLALRVVTEKLRQTDPIAGPVLVKVLDEFRYVGSTGVENVIEELS